MCDLADVELGRIHIPTVVVLLETPLTDRITGHLRLLLLRGCGGASGGCRIGLPGFTKYLGAEVIAHLRQRLSIHVGQCE
jgi:hypothetical protein